MTTPRPKITLVLVALSIALAPILRAAASSVGTLGQRYVEARVSRLEPDDALFFDRKDAGAFAFNLPIARAVDLTFAGSMAKARGTSVPGMLAGSIDFTRRERMAQVAATGYLRRGGVAPFARLAGGYVRSSEQRVWGPRGGLPGGRIDVKDDGTSWGAAAGMEIILGRAAITPAIDYFDVPHEAYADFERGWFYSVTAHLWLTPSLGGFAQAGHTRASENSAYRAWSWDAGFRFRF